MLSLVRYEALYLTIQELNETKDYPICRLCKLAGIQRSSYYKWLNRKEGRNEQFNKEIPPAIFFMSDGISIYQI